MGGLALAELLAKPVAGMADCALPELLRAKPPEGPSVSADERQAGRAGRREETSDGIEGSHLQTLGGKEPLAGRSTTGADQGDSRG